jgi:hypothetical protein
MKTMLFDSQGDELTEITSHMGGSSGHVLVDWATRPDALFTYYFDKGHRAVIAVTGVLTSSARLGTRWQMGARFWFLHDVQPLDASPYGPRSRFTRGTWFAPGDGASPDAMAAGALVGLPVFQQGPQEASDIE